MPASCEACGPVELWPENYEAWELINQYPGLIKQGMDGSSIDYQTALRIIDAEAYSPPLLMLRKLEAIRQGLCKKIESK